MPSSTFEEIHFPTWSLIYALIFTISLISSVAATWNLNKCTKIITSCVCTSMLNFFYWKCICCTSRLVIHVEMVHAFLTRTNTWLELDTIHDVGGFRFIGYDTRNQNISEIPLFVAVPIFVGDTALVTGAFWLFVLVIEMLRLVKTTVDRGFTAERKCIKMYSKMSYILATAYFAGSFVALAMTKNQYENEENLYGVSTRFRTNLIALGIAQTTLVVAMAVGVLYLKFARLKLESVECRVVQKPLYIRLKRIFYIYIITGLPYAVIGWIIAFNPTTNDFISKIPIGIHAISNMLYASSPCTLAFVLVANQKCLLSCCMVPEDIIQQIQANEPPVDFPVFVNTDIESSSALWGHLGVAMREAQELHDNLLRNLLADHNGYEITTAGDAFQLAFHNIGDAVAYCIDVQLKLLQEPWPQALVNCQMPGSATIFEPHSMLKRQKTIFHGVRVRMGIHASNPTEGDLVNHIHSVTGRMMYFGLSELIGREVSDLGHGGQIIVTAPVVRWLQANIHNKTPWVKAYPCIIRDLGIHHIDDINVEIHIGEVVIKSLKSRASILPPLSKIRRPKIHLQEHTPDHLPDPYDHSTVRYELLVSPRYSSCA